MCDILFAHQSLRYLSVYQFDNAQFYAERAYYENASEDNLQILVECNLQQGNYKQASLMLQNAKSKINRYLLALCFIKLGTYSDAESALLPGQYLARNKTITADVVSDVAGGIAGLYLLGKICKHENRVDEAIAYYNKCLEVSVFDRVS